VERVDATGLLDWLDGTGDDFLGFDPLLWEANAWILHALYETDEVPAGLTHDDVHRIERAAGTAAPVATGDARVDAVLDEILDDAVVIGGSLGKSRAPGRGWRRLRWEELLRRLDAPPLVAYPTYDSFPYRSWPASIRPPAEGSLDREQLVRLVELLGEESGADADCFAFFARLPFGNLDDDEPQVLYRGPLSELVALYDDEEAHVGPTNVWPADRSWFVSSDYDLWATRVSGRATLVGRMLADGELEAVELEEPAGGES
jgi:hypothetical protein